MPVEIATLLASHERTHGFRPELAIPELVTTLDDFGGEHRNHDLVVVGEAAAGRTLLAIEAKADESFGNHTVEGYIKLCARRDKEYPAKLKSAQETGKRRLLRPSTVARCVAHRPQRAWLSQIRPVSKT